MVILSVLALLLLSLIHILNLNRNLRAVRQDLEESNRELQRLSSHDGLTGVANHRLFGDTLAAEWGRAARERTPLSLIMADIDHFKLLNDSDGHLAGDECLKQVAQTLDQTVRRPTDLLARYGGEEFIAILPGVDAPGAFAMAERMRSAVESLGLPNHGTGGPVTISLGVASEVPRPGASSEAFVARVDRAMYQAKEAGRNCTRLAA
jgi:diguanylate cyclase (GGDEF)-like protein